VRGWLLPFLQHVKIFTVDEAFTMSGTRGLECSMPAIRPGNVWGPSTRATDGGTSGYRRVRDAGFG
jgi:hypothetical protein